MHVPRSHRRLAVFIVVRLLVGSVETTTVAAGRLASAGPLDTVVLHYAETLGEIAEADRGPSLTIHEDGTVEAHYPPYMRRAGDYRGRLSAPAVEAIVDRMVERGVLEFDVEAVRAQQAAELGLRAARAERRGEPAPLYVETDPSVTAITLRIDGIERTVTWRGLRGDAKRFPGIAALQSLRAAEQELHALMERGDLQRVP
jgi:hypothetical protein